MANGPFTGREDIPASETGLFIAQEERPTILPASPRWFEHDPNSYDTFGTEVSLVSRQPINSDRQDKKGTVVGFTNSGGFNEDLTLGNMPDLLQGFFFADLRTKSEFAVASFAADGIVLANGGTGFKSGDIIFVKGSTITANNGMRVLAADGQSTKIPGVYTVAGSQEAIVSRVGRQFAAGDLTIDVTGPLPKLASAAVDLTTLGLIPGEFIYVGGDASTTRFPDAANAFGWARIIQVTAGALTFDKTDLTWLAGSGAGKTIQIFFGRHLKNEQRDLIRPRTYSLRRVLGRPDLSDPNRYQSEVISGAVPGELTVTFPEENKVSLDIMFMARKYTTYQNDADIPGVRVRLPEEDAINTANDTVRTRMAVYPALGNVSAPTPLFAVFENFEFTVNNNLSENKGVGRKGSFSIPAGNFSVSGSLTGYFVDVASVDAIAKSKDVTFDICIAKNNKGIVIDWPLVALGSEGINVEANQSLRIDLDANLATGLKYHRDMNHTLSMSFFDYLPSAAMNNE